MAFATVSDAKLFLIDKIAARAIAEGCPLSDYERRMLGFCESAAETTSDSPSEKPRRLDPDDFDEEFEARMAELLRQSYEIDLAAGIDMRLYHEALATLASGDHYLSWIAEGAVPGPPLPEWLRPFKQFGLVVLLTIPALVALLIAAAALWAAIAQPSRSGRDTIGMSVVAFVFAGFGAFLFALWLRERRD